MNQVFQGTVLGPLLWNLFSADIGDEVQIDNSETVKFADDLTASKSYEHVCPNAHILADLSECQPRAHRWGWFNRVYFDSSKEHFTIIDRINNFGDTFRLLGVFVDTKLLKHDECARIVKKLRPNA